MSRPLWQKQLALFVVALLCAIGGFIYYVLSRDPCEPLFPIHDSSQLVSTEERELMRAVIAERHRARAIACEAPRCAVRGGALTEFDKYLNGKITVCGGDEPVFP
jgi:hypothetical protein